MFMVNIGTDTVAVEFLCWETIDRGHWMDVVLWLRAVTQGKPRARITNVEPGAGEPG